VGLALGVGRARRTGVAGQLFVELPLRWAERATRLHASASTPRPRLVLHDYVRLWPGLLAYALFGLGYIGYMTFVVAFLWTSNAASIVIQGFWVLLGVCAALCGFTWRPLLRWLAPQHALSCMLVALSVGAVLPVLVRAPWSFALSAVLFGSSFLAVVTAITAQARRTLPTERWTMVMGNATALFALGQLLGPTLTGMITDTPGGLALGLRASAVVLGVAAAIALIKPRSEGG